MINHNGEWLPSVYIGLPILVGSFVILVFLAIMCFTHPTEYDGALILGWVFSFVAVVLTAIAIPSYYPYNEDYHKLQPVAGIVQTVDDRFMAMSQYVIITYKEGATVRCDDSRCVNVKSGDSLRLLCTKEHEFGSPMAFDGWGCRWGQSAY